MNVDSFWVVLMAGAILALVLRHRLAARRRERFLADFRFPATLVRKVRTAYPHLTEAQAGLAIEGLREFFALSRMARKRMVAMPSQVVDVAWHEFILSTRAYQAFCQQALGRFLHHTPAEAMASPTQAQAGIRRAWRLSCLREHMNPRQATSLPLLFALDSDLSIPDGFRYALNCAGLVGAAGVGAAGAGDTYCASHIGCGSSGGCASGCGGDSGSGGGGSGDGGGCGGGCGGGD